MIDIEEDRQAVPEAWSDQPLEERRAALALTLREVTLTPGYAKVTYGYCHHEPAGPPTGGRPVWEKTALVRGAAPPKARKEPRRDHGWSRKVALVMEG